MTMNISSSVARSIGRVAFAAALLTLVVVSSSWLVLRADVPQVASGTWAAAGEVGTIPPGAASVALSDGRLLVAGGQSGDTFSSAISTYDAASGARVLVGNLATARAGHAATVLNDGRVLIAGGTASYGPTFDIEIYDPANGTSVHAGDMTLARVDHAAATLKDGRVLIVGGSDGVSPLSLAELFDPATGHSVGLSSAMSTARVRTTATTLLDGHVLVAGGSDGTNDLSSAEIFEPATESFFMTGAMQIARSSHVAVLLPNNNQVLIAGGVSAGAGVASAELYADWRDGFSATRNPMSVARAGGIAGGLQAYDLALVAGGGAATGEYYGYATVKTDREDYWPGEAVSVTGSGWQPGETVTLTISEDADTHYDFIYRAVADAAGNITNAEFAPIQNEIFQHFGKRFYVRASGAASEALNTFTDGNGTLNGTIRDSVTNVPIGGATIACSNQGTNACNNPAQTTSSADGTYTLTFQFKGNSNTANISVSAPGYTSQIRSLVFDKETQTIDWALVPSDTINKKDQTITFGPLNAKTYGDPAFTVSATASPSGLPVDFAAAGACSITGATVQITAAGECTITATQPGNAEYNPAQSVERKFSIAKAESTTLVSCQPGPFTYTGQPQEVCSAQVTGAGGLDEELPVSYSNNTNAGTATASAGYSETANHLASNGSKDFTIAKAATTVAVTCPVSVTYNGEPQEPCTATVTGAGGLDQSLTVSYSNNTNAGTATASASYSETANHLASNGSKEFTMAKAATMVAVTCPVSVTYNGEAQKPCTATVTGAGGLAQSLTVSYSNNTNAGTATASASYSETANHLGNTGSKEFTIEPRTLTITPEGGKTKILGATFTAFTGNVDGLQGTDAGTATYASLGAAAAAAVGSYDITSTFVFTSGNELNYDVKPNTAVKGLVVVYGWDGFLQPINDTAHDFVVMSKFKLGQTIPAKFVLKDAAGAVVRQTTNPEFTRPANLGACDANSTLADSEVVQADVVPQYKWDGSQYHYNWSTKGMTAGLYRIFAKLEDGTSRSVDICLTK